MRVCVRVFLCVPAPCVCVCVCACCAYVFTRGYVDSHLYLIFHVSQIQHCENLEEIYRIDHLSDLSSLTAPVIFISPKDILTIHSLLVKYLDKQRVSRNDPLQTLLTKLGMNDSGTLAVPSFSDLNITEQQVSHVMFVCVCVCMCVCVVCVCVFIFCFAVYLLVCMCVRFGTFHSLT